jgi:hypothetical protein
VDAPLLESLDTSTLVGLRDRALIGVLVVGGFGLPPDTRIINAGLLLLGGKGASGDGLKSSLTVPPQLRPVGGMSVMALWSHAGVSEAAAERYSLASPAPAPRITGSLETRRFCATGFRFLWRSISFVERQEGRPIRYRKIAPSAYINNKRGKGGLHNDNCDD